MERQNGRSSWNYSVFNGPRSDRVELRSPTPGHVPRRRADLDDLKIALLETENTLAKRLAEQEKLIRILKNVIADERNREPAVPAGGENYVPSQYRERNAA